MVTKLKNFYIMVLYGYEAEKLLINYQHLGGKIVYKCAMWKDEESNIAAGRLRI